MKLAVIFWFYKNVPVCTNHLQILKKHNPDLKIFGLYGGDRERAEGFRKKLSPYLDNFYICPFRGSRWKWFHGDLVLLDWFNKRGKKLRWDSVAIVQWDMLVFDSLQRIFQGLKKDQIFLSGLRQLSPFIEKRWTWTKKPTRIRRYQYLKFVDYLKEYYGYKNRLLCCLFILEVFPRKYFKCFNQVVDKELGMLEYKVPTYTKIFGIPFYKKDIGIWWFNNKTAMPLNARVIEVKNNYIKKELSKKSGWRIFHPYFKNWAD